MSRSKNMDLVFSSFFFSFYFPFKLFFIFLFSIFRTLGLGLEVIGHMVTPVTTDGVVTTLIIGLKRRKQKVLEQNNVITIWIPHVSLMLYT